MADGTIQSVPWYKRVGNITGILAVVFMLLDAFQLVPTVEVTEIVEGLPVAIQKAVELKEAAYALLGITAAEAATKVGRLRG